MFCEELAEASSGNDTRDFRQLVKNGISPTPSTMKARCVIGKTESVEGTLRLWKKHFGAIISSWGDKDLERDRKIFKELLETVEGKSKWPWWSMEITPSEVLRALDCLKLNKSTGPDGIESENLRYGCFDLAIHMSIGFTVFMRHAFVPHQFARSYIVLIDKDKHGDMSDPNNYRGIAISFVVSKAMEHVILDKFGHKFVSFIQQFGFKQNHGCSDCSFVLKETVNYYLQNGDKVVYSCALDLSKAYDNVKHYRLFCKLLQKGVPVGVVRLLATWYSSQTMKVKWKNHTSEAFEVTNGVRQGSVLSPCMFAYYLY